MNLPETSSSPEEVGTQAYYERHAKQYSEATHAINMSGLYDRFLRYLPPKGRILDAGSGSGRDTLAFLARGYQVEAFDSSPTLCELSSRLTGITTRILTFQEFKARERYDGIWACASLLHVPKNEMEDALRRLICALKPGGTLYLSFKHGLTERVAPDGRLFTDMDESRLRCLFTSLSAVMLDEIWISAGEGTACGKDEWLNAIAVKTPEVEIQRE